MGSKGKFVMGIVVLALGVLALCVCSSSAFQQYIVDLISGA
ncbi:MAG: hypothetical protein ACI4Q9_04195 [Candidatus Methanomethylophilaceae archaeon]